MQDEALSGNTQAWPLDKIPTIPFLTVGQTPDAWGATGQALIVDAAGTGLEFGAPTGSAVITRPEPALADASHNAVYGGGAGAQGQDYLSYLRLVASTTVRMTVHDLDAVGALTEKHGWASEAGLLDGNLVGGGVRPAPSALRGIVEQQEGDGRWRVSVYSDGTGQWGNDTQVATLTYVDVGLGGAAESFTLNSPASGVWSASDSARTVTPRFVSGRQYDLSVDFPLEAGSHVFHAGNELARIADQSALDAVEGEVRALIDDLRHDRPVVPYAPGTGALPAAEAFWDPDLMRSRVAAWTGTSFQRVGASNTVFPAVVEGTFLAPDNGTYNAPYRWRGVRVSNPSDPGFLDLYWSSLLNRFVLQEEEQFALDAGDPPIWTSYVATSIAENDPEQAATDQKLLWVWDTSYGPMSGTPVYANEALALAAAAERGGDFTGAYAFIGTGDDYELRAFTYPTYDWVDVYTGGSGTGTDSRLVFPEGGVLRPATAADWDAANNLPLVVGFTGSRWQRPFRTPVPRSAVYTPHGDGDLVGGNRWRGFGAGDEDIDSPEPGDFYRDVTNNRWRLRSGNQWITWADDAQQASSARVELAPNATGVYPSRQAALDALPSQGTVGKRQMFNIPGGGDLTLWVVATFTAAHDEFPWVDVGSVDRDVLDAITDLDGHIEYVTGEEGRVPQLLLSWSTVEGVNDNVAIGLPSGAGRTDEEVQDLVAAMFRNTESARVMYDDPAGTLSIDAPLPWTGRYLADLYDIDNLPNVPPAPAVAFDPDGGSPFHLTFRRWVTQTNPLSSIDHLPVGGFVGLRQGDELMVMRVLSPFDSTNSRYLVDVFHEATLAYTGASRGTEVLITAPNPFIDIDYDAPRRDIVARFADASRVTVPLSNLTAFDEADDEDVRLVDGHLLLEHDYDRLFLVTDAPSFEITSSELQDDLSSSDYITIPFSQGSGNRNQIFRGDGSRASLPWLFSGRIPESKIPRVVENINSLVYNPTARTFTLAWTDTDTSGTMDTLTSGTLPAWITASDLSDDILDGISNFEYVSASDEVVLTLDRLGGGQDTSKFTAPWLRPSQVEAWARGSGLIPDSAIGPDYLVAGNLKPYALSTFSGVIPTDALGTGTASSTTFLSGTGWRVPPNTGTPGTSTPDIYKVEDAANVAYSTESGRRRIDLTITGATSSTGTTVLFNYAEDPSGLTQAHEVEVGVNGAGFERIVHDDPYGGTFEHLTVADLVQNQRLLLHRTADGWHLIGGTERVHAAPVARTGNSDRWPAAKLGTGSAGANVVLHWLSGTTPEWRALSAYLTQPAGDARYARLASANTFTAAQTIDSDSAPALTVDSRGSTSSTPVLDVIVGSTAGRRRAFQAKRIDPNSNDPGWAWASLEFDAGGDAKPGLALGSGLAGASRDTNVYRDAPNHLKSDDLFEAAEMRLSTGTVNSRTLADRRAATLASLGVQEPARDGSTTVWGAARVGTGPRTGGRVLGVGDGTTAAWIELTGAYPGNDAVRDLVGAMVTASAPLTWSYDTATHAATLTSSARTEGQVNDQIEARRDFEWVGVTASATSTAYTLALNGVGDASVPTTRVLACNFIGAINFVPQRPDSLPVHVSYNGEDSGQAQLWGADGNRRGMTLGDLRQFGNTNTIHMFRRRAGSSWDWMGTAGAASGTQDVAALVEAFARVGNPAQVPLAKVPDLDASKVTSGAFDTARLTNAVTAARVVAVVDGTVGNNRIVGYDTSDAGLRWYDLPVGSGTDTNDYVDTLALALSGRELTLTAGRTGTLADLTASVTLPAGTTDTNDYVDALALALSGQVLTLTAGRTGSLADLTASVTLPAGMGTDTNDYVDALALAVSGQELTLTAGRTGTLGDLTASVTLPGGGAGLTVEEVRDAVADFAIAGDNMHIVHRDTDDELIFSASPPVEFTIALVINSTWDVFAVNVDDPELSYQLGRLTGVPSSLFQGATWHDGEFIATTQHVRNNGLWRVNLDTLVATQVSGQAPDQLQDARGIASHNGTVYVAVGAGTSRGLWRINLGNLSASARIGGWPTGVTGNIRDLFSFDGKLYMIMSNRDLWEIDTGTPLNSTRVGAFAGSSVDLGPFIEVQGRAYFHEDDGLRSADLSALTLTNIGDFPGSFGVVQAGTHVTTGLTTTFIREGSRPYYSDALVDTWADSNFNDRWDDRLAWAMAPAGDPTVVAQKVNVDGTVYGLRNTFSVDTPGQLPTPGILTRGQAYYVASNETLYWGVREHHLPTPASGDFDALSARSDMHVVTAQPANLNAYDVGDFLFINSGNWRIGGGTFSKVVSVSGTKQLQDTTAGDALADWKTAATQDVDFLGREATSADALEYTHSVEAGKDYFWFDTTDNVFKLLDQSTYVAPTGAVDHDRLKPIVGPGTGGTDTNDYVDSLAFALSGRALTLTAGRTGSLNDLTASVTLPAAGISQSDADARYARLANANTFTSAQTIDHDGGTALSVDSRASTSSQPVMELRTGTTSGNRKAFQAKQGAQGTAWASFEYDAGGTDKPGLALGTGSSGRDVNLYRDAANVLKTNDTFDAAGFRQAGDALGFTHLDGQLESSQLATDTTLAFAGDELGVNVQHVIEHLSERIRYVTDASVYSTRGATVMQIFNTGPYVYRVTHVSWDLDAPATGITARCRLYRLNDNNTVAEKIADTPSRGFSERGSGHYLYFREGGVLVPANSRIGVAFSRTDQSADSACFLKAGGEQANSPEHSYNNASSDWEYVGWGEYEHTNPGTGDGTVAHGGAENVYGNANIHYSIVIDHGQIVGDGTVDESHINSSNASEGQALLADDSDRGEWGDVVRPLTTGGGDAVTRIWRGTQDQYDALSSPDDDVLYVIAG